MKKPAGSVRFYKQKTKKTKPKKTRAKPEKSIQNRKKPRKPSQIGLTQFRFFLKNFGLVIFFDKNRTEPKIIIHTRGYFNLLFCIYFNQWQYNKLLVPSSFSKTSMCLFLFYLFMTRRVLAGLFFFNDCNVHDRFFSLLSFSMDFLLQFLELKFKIEI